MTESRIDKKSLNSIHFIKAIGGKGEGGNGKGEGGKGKGEGGREKGEGGRGKGGSTPLLPFIL